MWKPFEKEIRKPRESLAKQTIKTIKISKRNVCQLKIFAIRIFDLANVFLRLNFLETFHVLISSLATSQKSLFEEKLQSFCWKKRFRVEINFLWKVERALTLSWYAIEEDLLSLQLSSAKKTRSILWRATIEPAKILLRAQELTKQFRCFM